MGGYDFKVGDIVERMTPSWENRYGVVGGIYTVTELKPDGEHMLLTGITVPAGKSNFRLATRAYTADQSGDTDDDI